MSYIDFGIADLGESRVDGVVYPAGSDHFLTLLDGQQFILALALGQVFVSREDTKPRRKVVGNLLSPVILTQPGTYRIFAKAHSVGVRIERG